MAVFPFIGASYRARSRNFAAERCVNLYPETGNGSSKNVMALFGTPGKRLWLTLPTGPIRGTLRFDAETSVVVAGNVVYKVRSDKTFSALGNVDTLKTPVGMASNGIVVMLVTGPSGYVIDPTNNTVTLITSENFTGADSVQFIDGYFAFNKTRTGQFQITKIYSTDINGLDFATAEGAPDLLLSLLVDHRELWLFGETSTEVFFNSGNVDFPFERINGAFIEQGCAAKLSPAKLDNTVYWLSADERGKGMVQRAVGYQPQRVSTHALEYALARMPRIDDAVGCTSQQEGHSFYQLNFPSAEKTWVFDAATNLWHERAWRNPATSELKRDRAVCHMAFVGKNIVGDWENGNLYELDLDYYMDNGALIPRIRACPHMGSGDYTNVVFHSVQIDMQTGVGLDGATVQQGHNPQVRLRWSDDGGHSWSDEVWKPAGKIGERLTRVVFRRLGRSRDRVFEVQVTDPVKIAFVGANVAFTGGSS